MRHYNIINREYFMKWKSRYYLKHRLGERRIVRKFLWWPRRFDGSHWRWLEYADIVEEVCEVDVGGSMDWGNYSYEWREVGFAYASDGKAL